MSDITFAYEPNRIVRSSPGMCIELWRARPQHIQYAAKLGRGDTNGYYRIATEPFNAWADEQRSNGRPEAELVYDRFIRETGIWRP